MHLLFIGLPSVPVCPQSSLSLLQLYSQDAGALRHAVELCDVLMNMSEEGRPEGEEVGPPVEVTGALYRMVALHGLKVREARARARAG